MSMRQDVWCVDCEEGADLCNTNRMFDLPEVLIKYAALLGTISPLSEALRDIGCEGSLVLHSSAHITDFDWFAKHAGHNLVPRER